MDNFSLFTFLSSLTKMISNFNNSKPFDSYVDNLSKVFCNRITLTLLQYQSCLHLFLSCLNNIWIFYSFISSNFLKQINLNNFWSCLIFSLKDFYSLFDIITITDIFIFIERLVTIYIGCGWIVKFSLKIEKWLVEIVN